MAIPATPSNFIVQQANGQVLVTWNLVAGATTYGVQRSTDGVTYSTVSTPATNLYLDTTVTLGTQYWYQVASINSSGTSSYTTPACAVPTVSGEMSLGELRLRAQQRADLVNSSFVTTAEWNSYINQSYFELYDLLTTVFEDYYLATPITFTTDGTSTQYAVPNGTNYSNAQPLYKLMGIDLGLDNNSNAWVTIKKYDFISRNRYVFPNISSNYLGVFNLQYRMMGDNIMFIPTPSAGQIIRLWYVPRMTELLKDTDIAKGVSGWIEYIITDAAIKAMQKEESDVSVLGAQKMMLKQRIEESASNRDAGMPDTISDTRSWSNRWGSGGPNGDGPYGGY